MLSKSQICWPFSQQAVARLGEGRRQHLLNQQQPPHASLAKLLELSTAVRSSWSTLLFLGCEETGRQGLKRALQTQPNLLSSPNKVGCQPPALSHSQGAGSWPGPAVQGEPKQRAKEPQAPRRACL